MVLFYAWWLGVSAAGMGRKVLSDINGVGAKNASCLLVCLILFPSVGITVVQHCNTVGIHRSFPQGVV